MVGNKQANKQNNRFEEGVAFNSALEVLLEALPYLVLSSSFDPIQCHAALQNYI
jgi:hypothetical protein